MAKIKNSESIPDDIELLNIHRYPESVPASTIAFVRNSKVCQKRLEDLLKGMPQNKGVRGISGQEQTFTKEKEVGKQEEQTSFFRKLVSGLFS